MIFFFPFHLVTLSPWPILMSLSLMFMMVSMLKMLNDFIFTEIYLSMLLMVLILYQWWRDVVRESYLQGFHNKIVVKGMQIGMFLFIVSELFFFISFFWTFFHFMLSPSMEVGNIYPPNMINSFNPFNIPLFNTMILLFSGVMITLSHHSMLSNNYNKMVLSLEITLFLGILFTFFQFIEYKEAEFTMTDSSYGSIFFLATGFHGLHVLIGSMFIMISVYRMKSKQISFFHHFGFEACSWYWHFVDVVWLFLYVFVYWLIY